MLTCVICDEVIWPHQPVALVEVGDGDENRVRVIHLAPCGRMLLALDAVARALALAT